MERQFNLSNDFEVNFFYTGDFNSRNIKLFGKIFALSDNKLLKKQLYI